MQAAGIPLVQLAHDVAGVVVQRRCHDLAANLHVVVQFMLEVGHAVLLVAFLADVLQVANGGAAVVAVAGPRALGAFPARETAQIAGHEAVEKVARLVVVRIAEAGCVAIGIDRLRWVVAVGIDGLALRDVVVPGPEWIAAAWVRLPARGNATLVVSGLKAAVVEPLAFDLMPVGAAVGHQLAGGVANRPRPVARVAAVAAVVVGGQQLAGPVGRTDDVVRPIGELHPVLIADLQREYHAGALALRPGKQSQAPVGCAVLHWLLELVVDLEALEILARHDVDDAGDRLRAVQRGCAVEHCLDAADGDAGIEVGEVGAGAPGPPAVAGDVGRHAVAVHHRHGGAGAEAAQVGPDFAALLPVLVVAAAELERRRVGVDAHLEGLVEDDVAEVRRAGEFQIDFVDGGHRRREVEVVAADEGAGDDHLLDFFLVVFVFLFLGGEQGAGTQQHCRCGRQRE